MSCVASGFWLAQAGAWTEGLIGCEWGYWWFPPRPNTDAFRASRVRAPQPEVPRHMRNQRRRLTSRGLAEVRFSGSFFRGVGSLSRPLNVEEGAGNLSHLLLGGEQSWPAAGLPQPWEPQLAASRLPPRSRSAPRSRAAAISRLLGAAEPLRKCFCLCSAARFPMLLGTGSQLSCLLVCLY